MFIYLDVPESLICSRTLTIVQISAVNIVAESGNLLEVMVFDGKNCSTNHLEHQHLFLVLEE